MKRDAPSSLQHRLKTLLDDPSYRPQRRSELARTLGLGSDLRAELRQCLRQLQDRGDVIRLRRNRYARASREEEFTGILTLHPRGFGFVTDQGNPEREAYIPKESLRNALHGDRVRIAVTREPRARRPVRKQSSFPRDSWRGNVLEVVERENSDIVGVVQQTPYGTCVIPDDPRHTQPIRVRDTSLPDVRIPPTGRKVVLTLDPWKPNIPFPTGRIIEELGDAADPAVSIPSLMRRHHLEESFPDPAENEARAQSGALGSDDITGREDLRDRFVFTIDPDDAKDFDDAVSLEKCSDGTWRLGVHIADVAHVVAPNSDIDREAARRGTSTYLVDRTITMLPRHLTTEICSLTPDTDRLTHSVEIRLQENGARVETRTFSSIIRSHACLNYGEVQHFFDSDIDPGWPSGVAETLRSMRLLAGQLRAARMANGALDVQSPEVKCRLDTHGTVVAIELRTELESYRLIEEFMLLANQAVARRLGAARSPCLYRIHDEPDDVQWAEMTLNLEALGFDLPGRTREGLNHVLHRAAGTPMANPVTGAILRNLKRALYAPHHRPHFGLAFPDYTHFTSPIRRYADLITHRLLNAVEQGTPPPYRNHELKALGIHASKREREADEAERESVEIKRVEYYAALLEAGNTGPWTAAVVSVIPRGLLVQIPDTLQRGLLPFASLPGGYARATERRPRGHERAGGMFRIGHTLPVRLSRVDIRRKFVDFVPDSPAAITVGKKQKRTKPSPRRAHE